MFIWNLFQHIENNNNKMRKKKETEKNSNKSVTEEKSYFLQ